MTSKKQSLAVVTHIGYCVDLTLAQYLRLEARHQREYDADSKCDLDNILMSVTHAQKIEFNGHFGAAVFFTLGADHSGDSEVVAKIIKMYANRKTFLDIFDESLKSDYSKFKNSRGMSSFESAIGRYKDENGQVKVI